MFHSIAHTPKEEKATSDPAEDKGSWLNRELSGERDVKLSSITDFIESR